MGSATVRISLTARDHLRELSASIGRPMQAVIEEAIDLYRRHCFLEGVNAAYGALRQDPEAWAEIVEERAAWDATLADGLPKD